MTGVLAWRYLTESGRRPLNLVLLIVVPVTFVTLTADAIAEFAQLLGGEASTGQLEVATAGWAAAFLAGVGGFFHVAGSREPDRRLAAAASATSQVVAARLTSSLALALIASAGALVALIPRVDAVNLGRTVGATVMFAVIYLAIGSIVGALVRSEVNGSLIIVFIWLFDVFFGPAMGRTDALIPRFFPTHFPTAIMLDAASTTHGGSLGDIGISLVWTFGSLAVAVVALFLTTRPVRTGQLRRSVGSWARVRAGLRYAWLEYRRNVALWVLLIAVPITFISLSILVTPDDPAAVELTQNGEQTLSILSLTDVHGAIMVAISVAFLSGLAGLFVVLDSAEGDRRLVLAGFKPREVLLSRLGVITLAVLLVSAVSLATTAASFQPEVWLTFAVATFVVGVTYAMIGVVIGPLVGRLGGLYLMILLPFIDVGLAQNVMFGASAPAWGVWMPGRGAVEVLIDASFTSDFDQWTGLLLAVTWLVAIAVAGIVVFHRMSAPRNA